MSIDDQISARDDAGNTSSRDDEVDEAADFVHPVDHGAGPQEQPLEAEKAGSYVTGGEHANTAEQVIDDEEKGDYVSPVDHGNGGSEMTDEEAGDYTESDLGRDDGQRDRTGR